MKTVYTVLLCLSLLMGLPVTFAALTPAPHVHVLYLLVGIFAALVCGAAYEGARQESEREHHR